MSFFFVLGVVIIVIWTFMISGLTYMNLVVNNTPDTPTYIDICDDSRYVVHAYLSRKYGGNYKHITFDYNDNKLKVIYNKSSILKTLVHFTMLTLLMFLVLIIYFDDMNMPADYIGYCMLFSGVFTGLLFVSRYLIIEIYCRHYLKTHMFNL